jgi:hypothetical protein
MGHNLYIYALFQGYMHCCMHIEVTCGDSRYGKILTLVVDLCCVSLIKPTEVVAGAQS